MVYIIKIAGKDRERYLRGARTRRKGMTERERERELSLVY